MRGCSRSGKTRSDYDLADVQVAKHLIAMSFDEADHRLFVTTRNPGKLIVLNTDSGKVVTSLPCVGDNDDMAYDSASKRIYVSGSGFVDVITRKMLTITIKSGMLRQSLRPERRSSYPSLRSTTLVSPITGRPRQQFVCMT